MKQKTGGKSTAKTSTAITSQDVTSAEATSTIVNSAAEVASRQNKPVPASIKKVAKKVGVTQGRIAQIESRVGTAKVALEILLSILRELGYEYKIVARKVA